MTAEYKTKPRVWIERHPGRDFANRSLNLWACVNPFDPSETWYLGMVALFTPEETLRDYRKKITRRERRIIRRGC